MSHAMGAQVELTWWRGCRKEESRLQSNGFATESIVQHIGVWARRMRKQQGL